MKKILYITPHLSTGGAPQYLLKKIQLLKDVYEIYVIEYSDYGIYRVQKNQIIELIGDRLITLGENKNEILRHISDIEPDIVHLEEIPEFFMDDAITKEIYFERYYKIFETSHDSSFSHENKRFLPDKFLFCSDNQILNYRSVTDKSCVVEYPTDDFERPSRDSVLKELGLNPEYKHVLNVGLFTHRKNQGEIFEYAKRLKDQKIQFHFIGNNAPNFEEYWGPLFKNVPSNCKIWGERSDVSKFLSCMDLFLFTSKGNPNDIETNPLSLKEALGHHIPVLCYNLPTYKNRLDRKVTYLSDNFDRNVMKICNLLNLPNSLIECELDSELRTKVHYNFKEYFECLNNKVVCIYELKSNLMVYRTQIVHQAFWMQTSSNENVLNGFIVRIFDVDKNTFGNLSDENVFSQHNLLYQKVFDFPRNEDDVVIKGKVKKIVGAPDDPSAWFTMYEIFISKVYQKLKLEKDDIVVDIGGHYGFFDLFAVDQGAKEIYTIEPTLNTFKILSKNLYEYENVKRFNFAIAEKNEEREFITTGASAVNSLYENVNNHESNETTKGVRKIEKVNCITFHDFLINNNIDRVDAIKMDCEGAEWEIFPTISDDFLKYRLRKITMEVHDMDSASKEDKIKRNADLLKRFQGLGYKVEYDPQIMQGKLGNMWAWRIPKIKLVHMIIDENGVRERKSIEHLKKLCDIGNMDYFLEKNEIYTSLPPSDTCARPAEIQMEPGHYKLAPAHYGNFLAHRNAITKHLSDTDYDAVIFCECDAILIKEPRKVYKEIIDRLDDMRENDLNFMNFGKRILTWGHNEHNKYYGVTDRMSEAHFYMIPTSKNSYYQTKFDNTLWDTYDLWLNTNIFIDMKSGITTQPFSIQCSGNSYLDKTYKDGTTLLSNGDIEYE